MYNSFFGFKDKPFNVTPDPRFYYANRSYQEAYASLLYGIQERKGFIVLTGEVGVGKTTLLRRLISNLGANVRFSFLYNTNLSFDELLTDICDDLGLDVEESSRLKKINALNDFLIDRLKSGETVAILIDEAQNLRVDVLEELRVLSNLETSNEKLLQMILVGQPELEEKLNRNDLRQLKQRIAIRCRLKRLQNHEVSDFIQSRLETAGYAGRDLFSQDAVRAIAHYSHGLPRLINNICDNALLISFAANQHTVAAAIVEEVASDLELTGPTGPTQPEPVNQGNVEQVPQLVTPSQEVVVPPFLRPRQPRRVRRAVFAVMLLLAVLGAAVSVANPYHMRARLAQRGLNVEKLLNYLETHVSGLVTWVKQRASSLQIADQVAAVGTDTNVRDRKLRRADAPEVSNIEEAWQLTPEVKQPLQTAQGAARSAQEEQDKPVTSSSTTP